MQLKKTPFALAVIVWGAGAIPLAAQTTSSPYSGTPIALPASSTFEASKFDKGGQNVAYKDLTAGNAGGQFRTTEDVDIIASTDTAGGPYAINYFQTGEWLAYTVNVAETKNYDLAIRASNNQATAAAFHIEVDGANVTGSISVPKTGSWTTFQWFGKQGVPLTAGKHVIKVVSDQQYFNMSAIRAVVSATQPTAQPPAATYTGTPYSGTPVALPKAFEASKFDKGGQNVAYKDLTAGNSGGQFRTTEDVDIIASTDTAGGPYAINNFQTGEWLAYTVSVPSNANYDLAIRAANNQATAGAFHMEVDGSNVTGPISVPKTGGWTTFQWVGKQSVPLTAGKHVIKVVSEQQYFNMSAVSVLTSAAQTPPTPTTTTGGTAPSVSLTSPTSGQTVSGTLNYAATVGSTVTKVDFSVSSTTPMSLGTKTAAPFGGTLDTTKLENGSHTLTAVATDAQGKTSTSQVAFSVQNATQVPATKPASLLFWSGFESGVSVGAPRDCYASGCWQDVLGTDATTGFAWPPRIAGGTGQFQDRSGVASTPTTLSSFIVNDIQTVTGRNGTPTRALHQLLKQNSCTGTAGQGGCATQDPYLLQPAAEPGDTYISFWRKFDPALLQKLVSNWNVLFEWKTAGDYRIDAMVVTYSGPPQFQITADNNANGGLPKQEFWRVVSTASVPIGQWFKFEVFWHRSKGSDGRVWMAVNGQKILDKFGPNVGVNNAPIDRIFLAQLYTGGTYPIEQWTDDVQIWAGFPVAKAGDPWYDGVYGPH